jgi:hypothetical protein
MRICLTILGAFLLFLPVQISESAAQTSSWIPGTCGVANSMMRQVSGRRVTPAGCRAWCRRFRNCIYWTYTAVHTGRNNCRIYNHVPRRRQNSACVSGQMAYRGGGGGAAGRARFEYPKLGGRPLDHCWVASGGNCGQNVATAWCRQRGFRAAIRHKTYRPFRARRMDGTSCVGPQCQAFRLIVCR